MRAALAAHDYLVLAIRNYHHSGNSTIMRVPLAVLAALLDRLGRHEPAATIAGEAFSPITKAFSREINSVIAHLCDVLGEVMTTIRELGERGIVLRSLPKASRLQMRRVEWCQASWRA